jgi:hypothetical protein
MMAPKNEIAKIERNLEFVDTTLPAAGTANREAAGGTAWPGGRFVANANGSEEWYEVVRDSKLDPKTALARFAVVRELSLICVFAVESGTKGAVRVLCNPDRPEVGFHMAGVYKEHDYIRPAGTRSLLVHREMNEKEVPYLVLDMATAVVKPRSKRGSSEDKSGTAAAPKKAEPAADKPAGQASEGAAN